MLIILLVPAISAIQFSLLKQSYEPRETLQAEISGNFQKNLVKQDFFLYREGQNNKVATDYDMIKDNEIYYLYMTLPNSPGNYSINIKEAEFIDKGVLKTEDITKYFTIENYTGTALAISKGFVSTINAFSVTITSLLGDQSINVNFEATNENLNFNLREEETQTVRFSFPVFNKSFKSNLKINDYNIPVFITGISGNDPFATPFSYLAIDPENITGTVLKNNPYIHQVSIHNIGDRNLQNLNFSFELPSNLEVKNYTPKSLLSLKKGEKVIVTLNLSTSNKASGILKGNFTITYENKKLKVPIIYNITTDPAKVTVSTSTVSLTQTCAQQGGQKCNSTTTCQGTPVISLDGTCCKGICKPLANASSKSVTGKLVGIFIALVVLLIIGFLYYKNKRQKTPKSEDIIKKQAEDYEKRFQPDESIKEVKRRISRI